MCDHGGGRTRCEMMGNIHREKKNFLLRLSYAVQMEWEIEMKSEKEKWVSFSSSQFPYHDHEMDFRVNDSRLAPKISSFILQWNNVSAAAMLPLASMKSQWPIPLKIETLQNLFGRLGLGVGHETILVITTGKLWGETTTILNAGNASILRKRY